jgi:hypothetical protein
VFSVPEGETESQAVLPLATEALTVMRLDVEEVTVMVLRTRAVLPAVPESDTELGEMVRGLL